MCKFKCNQFSTMTAVTVIADHDLAKECLLGLRVVRSWPAMNNLFNKMSEVIGVKFGSINKSGGRLQLNQIKAEARPTIEVDDDFKSLIATPTATKQQQAACDACGTNGHVQMMYIISSKFVFIKT